jgi:hypothetical protein
MVGDNLYIAETYTVTVHDSDFPETLIAFGDGVVGASIYYPVTGPTNDYIDHIMVYSPGVPINNLFLFLYPGDFLYIQDLWTLSLIQQPLGKNLSPYIAMKIPYPQMGSGAPVYITKYRLRGGLNP